MRLKFFTTGGTFDKIYFDKKSEFEVGETYIRDILERANVSFDYSVDEIVRKDSLDLTDDDRALILEKVRSSEYERIVITHGTDTIAITGRLLKQVPRKTIVLTGSMQPARFRDTDADFNLGAAVAAAVALPAGVYVVINGRIFDPDRIEKNVKLNRFEEKS